MSGMTVPAQSTEAAWSDTQSPETGRKIGLEISKGGGVMSEWMCESYGFWFNSKILSE